MALRSFIDVLPDSHFPLENLPFGVFKPGDGAARIGVALGEQIVDLSELERAGLFRELPPETAAATTLDSLNRFLDLGRPAWKQLRETLQHLLSAETPTLRDDICFDDFAAGKAAVQEKLVCARYSLFAAMR